MAKQRSCFSRTFEVVQESLGVEKQSNSWQFKDAQAREGQKGASQPLFTHRVKPTTSNSPKVKPGYVLVAECFAHLALSPEFRGAEWKQPLTLPFRAPLNPLTRRRFNLAKQGLTP